MNIDFIRTSSETHQAFVRLVLQYLFLKGDIVEGQYQGWYCVPCEAFFSRRTACR